MDLRSKALLGVDIGSHSVKIVESRRTYGGIVLSNFGIQEIDQRGRQMVADRRTRIVSAVRNLLDGKRIKTRRCVCALGGSQVITRRILLPLIPEKEWPQAIAWEARNQTHRPLEECLFSYRILGRVQDRDGIEKTAVLLAIVPEEEVLSLLSICREAGLEPVALTVTALALCNLLQRDLSRNADSSVHMNIGAEATQMLFLREGQLQFTREILTGGQAVTDALIGSVVSEAARLDLDKGLAEGLKKELGIPPQEETAPITYQGKQVSPSQIAAMMRPALERLLTEVQRSFEYYREQFGAPPLQGVTLSGGGALLKNLVPFLAQGLGTRVEKLDSLKTLQTAPGISRSLLQELAPPLATAIGLSLDPAPQIDLLPARMKRERKMRGLRLLVKAAAISAVLSVAFLFLMAQVQTYYYRNALEGRRIELSNLSALVKEGERMAGIKDATARKLEIYQQLVLREPMMHGILKEISRLTPREIQLTEISYGKGRLLRLKGLAFSSQGPERVLARYMASMESSPFFQDVDLYSAKEMGGYSMRASQFELGLSLK